MQILTNLLLANTTVAAQEVTNILPGFMEDQQEKQDQVVFLLQNQLNQTKMVTNTIQQNQQIAIDQRETLDQMASTQTQMTNALAQMVDMQTQMVNMQTQIANTQTQMANSMDRVVSLLQIHNQQFANIPTSFTDQVNENNQTAELSDCSYKARINTNSGVQLINPGDGLVPFHVYCDMDTHGGGWTVFQRRFDGSVDFFLGWNDYEQGFGNVSGEYWLGLQQVHRLTRSGGWTLRIDMEDYDGNVKYAQYEDFQIGDAASFYQLSIGAFSGTVGFDGLAYHNGRAFSTKDNDHDACYFCQSYNGS